MPHFTQSDQTMLLFPLSDLSMQAHPICDRGRHPLLQAHPIRDTGRHPLLGVARTLRRRSSLSLTGIDDDSALCYCYMMQC
ncbi:hypothetical protein Hanom_Chr12g01112501 [Helianthus anomalus]